jgi:hypothetical protein
MSTRVEPHFGPALAAPPASAPIYEPAPVYQPAPMVQEIISTERRPRGFGGRLVALLFWGFEIFMGLWLFSAIAGIHQSPDLNGDYEGLAIIAAVTVLIWIWLFGTIILGIMMAFSRGEKITVIRRV